MLVGNFDEILGHGVRGVRSFFTAETPDAVPVDEIVLLIQQFAFPYFDRYGRDLRSFLTLTTGLARSRPERRGTWTTEAWTAGACTLLGDWEGAGRAWANCLTELAYFDGRCVGDVRIWGEPRHPVLDAAAMRAASRAPGPSLTRHRSWVNETSSSR